MILELIVFSLIGSTSNAQTNENVCKPLFNKLLSDLNYGTFDKESKGVTKQIHPDGTIEFSAPGGSKVRFYKDKITQTTYFSTNLPAAKPEGVPNPQVK